MAQKSFYETGVQEAFELFRDYLEGAPERPVLVVSSDALPLEARNAIEKSAAALGLGEEACTYARLDECIDKNALFLMMEGIDPLYVVCTDGPAAQRLGETYRTEYILDGPARVFGRPGVTFANLEALIADDAGKRRAWELFKTLA